MNKISIITPLLVSASVMMSCAHPLPRRVVVRPVAVAPVPVNTSYVRVLPKGYQTVRVSGTTYYYHANRWYRTHNGRYVVVSRPRAYRGRLGAAAVHKYRKH